MAVANSEIPRSIVRPTRWRQRNTVFLLAMLSGLLAACSRSDQHDYSAAPLALVTSAAIPPARADGWISRIAAKPTSP